MAEKLTGKQREEFQKAFDMFKEDSGNIPNDKLYATIKSLMPDLEDRELKMMINYVDIDCNGEIDIEEFLAMMASHLGVDEPDEIKDAFKCLDNAMDGTVNTSDLEYVIENLANTLPEKQKRAIIKELDPDGFGKVSYQVFKEVFCF